MLRFSLVQAGHRAGLSDLTFRGLNARPHSSQSRYTREPGAPFFSVIASVICFRQSFLSEGRTVARSRFTRAARSGRARSADCIRISLFRALTWASRGGIRADHDVGSTARAGTSPPSVNPYLSRPDTPGHCHASCTLPPRRRSPRGAFLPFPVRRSRFFRRFSGLAGTAGALVEFPRARPAVSLHLQDPEVTASPGVRRRDPNRRASAMVDAAAFPDLLHHLHPLSRQASFILQGPLLRAIMERPDG